MILHNKNDICTCIIYYVYYNVFLSTYPHTHRMETFEMIISTYNDSTI